MIIAKSKIDSIPATLSLGIGCGFISKFSSGKPLTFWDMLSMSYHYCLVL